MSFPNTYWARRALVVMAVVAGGATACSSGGTTAGDASYACPQTVAQRCAEGDPPAGQFGVHCAATLMAAQRDPMFCDAPSAQQMTCGGYTVIRTTNVDFSYLYYYDSDGILTAITSQGLVLGQRCLAGDHTFAVPHSTCTTATVLPACVAADAGTD